MTTVAESYLLLSQWCNWVKAEKCQILCQTVQTNLEELDGN